ncbi:MAG: hypothetical protein DRN53_02330 [Thermoprotei archaeon]|nr:MAG: hypothetical protein DRN53_02330 [Thermoprotei archaeon]
MEWEKFISFALILLGASLILVAYARNATPISVRGRPEIFKSGFLVTNCFIVLPGKVFYEISSSKKIDLYVIKGEDNVLLYFKSKRIVPFLNFYNISSIRLEITINKSEPLAFIIYAERNTIIKCSLSIMVMEYRLIYSGFGLMGIGILSLTLYYVLRRTRMKF